MNMEFTYDAASKQAKCSDPEIYVERLSVSRRDTPFRVALLNLWKLGAAFLRAREFQ